MNRVGQSLKFQDWLRAMLMSWKRFVLLMLIGAILGVGVALIRRGITDDSESGGLQSPKSVELTDKQKAEIVKDLEANNDVVKKSNDRLAVLKKRHERLLNRLENSVYLSIDHKNQPVASFEVNLELKSDLNESDDIVSWKQHTLALEYLKHVTGNVFFDSLVVANNYRVDIEWMKELVSARLNNDNKIEVEVTGSNKDMVLLLVQTSRDYFRYKVGPQLVFAYPHDVEIGGIEFASFENVNIKRERDLLEKENDDLLSEMKQEQNKADEIKDKAFAKKIAELETIEKQKVLEEQKQNGLISHVVQGLLLGFILALISSAYRVASLRTVFYPDEYAEKLGLFYLGDISITGKAEDRKRVCVGDRSIGSAWKTYKAKTIGDEVAIEKIASIIRGVVKTDEMRIGAEIAVIGNPSSPEDSDVVSKLGQALSIDSDGQTNFVHFSLLDIENPEGLKFLQESDCSILLIRGFSTMTREVERAIGLTRILGVQLIGVVGLR